MPLDPRKNFAIGALSTGYDASATSIVLASGHGARFPAPSFNATWWNSTDFPDPSEDPNVEIVRVTGVSTDTLTITRAQEGTSASTKNTAGKVYRLVAGITKKTLDDIAATADVQIFTADGTWTRPDGAKLVMALGIGGGGGGGGGRRGASDTTAYGGSGGAGAAKVRGVFSAALLGSTEDVTVGAGGAGGLAGASDGTNGSNGGAGTDTTFGDWLKAPGGAAGAGGNSISTTAGGVAVWPSLVNDGSAGSGGTSGAGFGNGAAGGNSSGGGAGGGGGGGRTSDGTTSEGGNGGSAGTYILPVAVAGGISYTSTAAENAETNLVQGGGGGAGGGSFNPSHGGDGGLYGGGGGGGMGAWTTSAKNGGNGADGILIVVTFF